MTNLKIAIMGTRGIPARYGGFETFAEELSVRLAARGHEVTVYCRSYNMPERAPVYRGVRLVHLPTIRHKYLDTIVHTYLSAWHSVFKQFDAVLFCNAANSMFIPLARLRRPVAINVDGIERKRKKWNAAGRLWYRGGERMATIFADRLISDAEVIRQYYLEQYGRDSVVIAYGSDFEPAAGIDIVEQLGLKPREYVLYVSRLEPENNAHLVIEAFEGVKSEKKLAIVGDAPYAGEYIKRLKSTRDPRIVFTGAVYGQGYAQLQSNAYCYVQATEVGGTHPALIEAMGAGNCVIANGTPENVEVVGDAGFIFAAGDAGDLREKLQRVLDEPALVTEYGKRARERARSVYNWDKVTDQYERLFLEMARKQRPHQDQTTSEN